MLIVQIVAAAGHKVHRVLQKFTFGVLKLALIIFFEELLANMQASKPCIYFPRYLTCASARGLAVHRVIWFL